MTMITWDPFRSIAPRVASIARASDRPWAPPVDVFEKGDDLVLRVELPGVSREDIDVQVEHGVLSIRGERKRGDELREANTYRVERRYGAFGRSFTLPETFDATGIRASYRDGVLEVTVPRAAAAKPRTIEVRAA